MPWILFDFNRLGTFQIFKITFFGITFKLSRDKHEYLYVHVVFLRFFHCFSCFLQNQFRYPFISVVHINGFDRHKQLIHIVIQLSENIFFYLKIDDHRSKQLMRIDFVSHGGKMFTMSHRFYGVLLRPFEKFTNIKIN